MIMPYPARRLLYANIGIAAATAVLLTIKSLMDFSHTGPQIHDEIMHFYSGYAAYAIGRLAIWAFLISFLLSGVGMLLYGCSRVLQGKDLSLMAGAICGILGLCGLSLLAFLHQLLYIPSSITASWNYDIKQLLPVWRLLSPGILAGIDLVLLGIGIVLIAPAIFKLWRDKKATSAGALLVVTLSVAALLTWANWFPDAAPVRAQESPADKMPNIVMIGSDTLRGDRIGLNGYPRNLTPFIDKLAAQGTFFANAYVPLARTAPSLTSLFTGTWPHTHGIRENYVSDQAAKLAIPSLPELLTKIGYRTATVGDWAASDLGKLSLGFQEVDTAPDQWNLKYLIRQGPKDIRLFLTLFTHNRFGRTFLPELYYLAGIPLTSQMTREVNLKLNDLAAQRQPFFLNIFIASTHPPFGSEYPYYTLYSNPSYNGDSKFAISGLTDVRSIIKRQEEGRKDFDVQQVIDLYDGSVRQFDDAVARIVGHLRAQGLDRNTIIVIYSDHGTDLFEKNTWGQGNSILGRDPSAHIPLLIVDPRRPGGAIVKHLVRSIDVAPTLLSLVNQPVPSSMEGVSLIPYMENPQTDLHLDAFFETGLWLGHIPDMAKNHLRYPSVLDMLEVKDKQTGTLSIKPEFEPRVIEARDRMIRSDRWKLVYRPMQEGAVYSLYDVIADPDCNVDVIGRYPEVAAQLEGKLIAWISDEKKLAWDGSHLVPVTQR